MIRQLAPGMVQQMQSVCSDCNGEGEPAHFTASLEMGGDSNILAGWVLCHSGPIKYDNPILQTEVHLEEAWNESQNIRLYSQSACVSAYFALRIPLTRAVLHGNEHRITTDDSCMILRTTGPSLSAKERL